MAEVDDVIITVPHITQRFRWDCGLACVQMVLSLLNKPIDQLDAICQSLNIGESIWTIDLARIVRHFGIEHLFCTVTLGVDDTYARKTFYKERFDSDQSRINALFEKSKELGLNIQQRTVSIDEIKRHLLKRQVAIVLVDWNLLSDSVQATIACSVNCMGNCLSRVGAYQGHFIVVCGYSAQRNVIYYKNPSSRRDCCMCSVETFNRARQAHGTDEDILFIYSSSNNLNCKQQQQQQQQVFCGSHISTNCVAEQYDTG